MLPPDANPAPPRKKKPFWRRFLLQTGLFVLFLTGALLLVAEFFNGPVTRLVLAEVNKNLKHDVQVESVNLSLFSGFPNASVNLENVKVRDAFGGELLRAREVAFRFKLLSLFSDQIVVRSVLVRDGSLRLRVNAKGQPGYDIAKPSSGPSTPSAGNGLKLALQDAELRNMLVLYDNAATQTAASLLLDNLFLSGNFSEKKFNLASRAKMEIARVQMDKSRYLMGETLKYKALIAVDMDKDFYDFQQVDLTLGGNTFSVDGFAFAKKNYTDLNLKLNSNEGDISVVFDLLPDAYYEYFKDFQSAGQYACSGLIKGRLSETQTPTMNLEVQLRNGKITSEKLQSPLRNVSFVARFDARPGSEGSFAIENLQGDFGGKPFGMNLTVRNLADPVVDFRCHGELPLGAAYGLLNNENISGGDGTVSLSDLEVHGRYDDMVSMHRIANVASSGELRFDRARITYKKTPLLLEEGSVHLAGNTVDIKNLKIRAGDSDLAFSGTAYNLLPVLFADSLNSMDAVLKFSAGLKSEYLDVNQLLGLFSIDEDEGAQTENPDSVKVQQREARERNFDKLQGAFNADIAYFKVGRVEGRNFKGNLGFNHNRLAIVGNTDIMQGQVNLNGEAIITTEPQMTLRIVAKDLDLETLMFQCENFGQDMVTDENLRGRLSGRIAVEAFWNPDGVFDMSRLKAYADVTARDGELVDLKMLEDFSSFVHLEDLRRVKFREMQNFLEVSNRKFYLPVMFIQSNALNLTISGVQSFEEDIDYKLKVNAGQTVLNRLKKHDPNLDPLPAEKGLFNLYYTIIGTLDQYDMKKGKRAVRDAFEQSESRKRVIAIALDRAFQGKYTQLPAPNEPDVEYLDAIEGGSGRSGGVLEGN